MEINCWIAVGKRKRLRVPDLPERRVGELREAIGASRGKASVSNTVLFEEPRRFGPWQRALARLVVGASASLSMFGLVGLVVLGSGTRGLLGLATLGVALFGAAAAAFATLYDVGLELRADGRLRRSGWGGVSEVNLRDYQRVTVKERARSDSADGWIVRPSRRGR